VQFRVLGPVEIVSGGQPLPLARRQERCLLAILLLAAGRVVSAERLCALLWDDNPPESARRILRIHVTRIRAVLARAGAPTDILEWDRDGYLIRVDPETVDAHRFRRLLDQARTRTNPADRHRTLREALSLWRGPALQDAASDRLRERICVDLDELHLHAIEESLAARLQLGHERDLVPELTRLSDEHPLRERLVELRMLALHHTGRTSEALDAYTHFRTRLADQLGLDPGPALRELQTAILRGSPLPTPPADTGIPPAQLPADLTAFTGRAHHLRQLNALLGGAGSDASVNAVVISAIAGTAGVGKTALAVHWAHTVRDRFPDGQLYVNLRGFDPAAEPTPATRAVRGFLDALNVPAQRIPAEPDAQIGLYRSLLADRRVLVVLDNARDTDQVRPLLPGAPGCATLVTSRNRLTGLVAIDGARPLTLDLLTAEEARQLLAARLGKRRVASEPAAIDDLIELCARLPLALAIAAAHAATEPDTPLATLAAQLHGARSALDGLTGDSAGTDFRAVFACSYHALNPDAARLFRLLSLHPGPDTSAAAAASLAGVSLEKARLLLAELTRAHLVNEQIPGRYAFHDLLRAYATEQTATHDPEVDRHAALHRLFDHYLHTAYAADSRLDTHRDPITLPPVQPGVSPETLANHAEAMAWFTIEHQVLLAAIGRGSATGFDTHAWQLAWTLAVFLDWRGHRYDSAATQEAAVDAARRVGDRHGQAVAHRLLAATYLRLGRQDDAITHLGRALELLVDLGDHAGQARTHLGMVRVLQQQDGSREALDHAQQALDLNRTAGNRAGQAAALNSIGWCYAKLGDYQQALAHCRQALTPHQQVGDRYGEANTWDSLGYAHHHLGQYGEAVACYQQALDIFRGLEDRHNQAETLRNLGETQLATGDLDATRDTWQQALEILDELSHPDADIVRTKLKQLP
jgi:DNA-binding SARP family transcriptional activator/tetratricopeptide (TPR) repeat protein